MIELRPGDGLLFALPYNGNPNVGTKVSGVVIGTGKGYVLSSDYTGKIHDVPNEMVLEVYRNGELVYVQPKTPSEVLR